MREPGWNCHPPDAVAGYWWYTRHLPRENRSADPVLVWVHNGIFQVIIPSDDVGLLELDCDGYHPVPPLDPEAWWHPYKTPEAP